MYLVPIETIEDLFCEIEKSLYRDNAHRAVGTVRREFSRARRCYYFDDSALEKAPAHDLHFIGISGVGPVVSHEVNENELAKI
jgi:hypothetical protein